jgi:hypothetical protein
MGRHRTERREVAVYNGQVHVGRIEIYGRRFTAFDLRDLPIGEFPDQRSAARAVINAAMSTDVNGCLL